MPKSSSRSERSALLLAGAVLLASVPAHAFELTLLDRPLRLDITESLQIGAHLDPGNGLAYQAYYDELISRLNVQASWNGFSAGVRLDSDAYVNVPQPGERLSDAQCPQSTNPLPTGCAVQAGELINRFQTHLYDPRKFFEKMFLGYSDKWVDVTVGDSYVSLGRGMVLSLRKLDQLAVDTTLMGVKASVHVHDFSTTLVAGWTNTQNLDDSTALYTPDPFDLIFGGRIDYRILGKVSVGIEGAGGTVPGTLPGEPPTRHARAGVVVDAPRPISWLSLYAEYVRQDDAAFGVNSIGSAAYASATVFAGITSWLLEFKDYQNFQPWDASNDPTGAMVYMAPPTLERVQIQLLDDSWVTAGRLRTDVRVSPWLTLYVSPEFGENQPGGGQQHDTLLDLYGSAEFRWNDGRSHAFPLLEIRHETDNETGAVVENLVAIECDAAQAITGPWSLELQELVWIRNKPIESYPWQEGNIFLGVKWAPRFQANAGYEFTTEQQYAAQQHNFFNGSVQWNITSAINLNLFAGGQRPGLLCISGVCRIFPAFEGVRLTFTARG